MFHPELFHMPIAEKHCTEDPPDHWSHNGAGGSDYNWDPDDPNRNRFDRQVTYFCDLGRSLKAADDSTYTMDTISCQWDKTWSKLAVSEHSHNQ